ncbi:MAG: hypothetical protein AAFY54_07480 [Cyanobacteria bacterium J06648_10]
MFSLNESAKPASLPLAECYQILQLHANATAEAVDEAYFRLRAQDIRQGDRKHLPELKAARATIKAHLQTVAPSAPAKQANPTNAHVENDSIATEALVDTLKQHNIVTKISVRGPNLNLGVLDNDAITHSRLVAKVKHLLSELDPDRCGLAEVKTVHLYGLNQQNKAKWKKSFPLPQPQVTADDTDLYSFNNRYSNTIIFPGLLLVSAVLNLIGAFKLLLLGIDIWIHEFGHATVAWLSGRKATPLPFGWTNVEPDKSLFVYFGLLTLFGVLFWSGYKEKRRWPMGLAIALTVIQFVMTWGLSADTFDMLLSFGGIGGEFYLSTLLTVSFFFPLPEYWRWDFFRYPAVVFAGFTFLGSLWHWRQIDRGLEAIPWGSLFGGADHIGGDMNQLSIVYGWSDQRIIDTYNGIGSVCVIAILSVYLYFFIKQRSHLWLHRLWKSSQR